MIRFNIDIIFGPDKIMHFFAWGFFSTAVGLVIFLVSDREIPRLLLARVWFMLSFISIIEEYRHYKLESRSAEFLDACANLLGITCGLLIVFLLTMWRYKIHASHMLSKNSLIILATFILPLLLGLLFITEKPFIEMNIPVIVKNSP
ncbi:hypothetical protein EJF36_18555 [Bacillus sp. HMF5848]|uniref:hypothetical protein n=1 Tax=Bacillus sp. HMF5848 TaxID=2495421 RepID=UPI000F78D47B|nr:hypothetical protein [Bacillus sp. HMF5848]RSK28711.1 hypothetical protein EJF36_18555 [Bacillus sp. HMF5848]